MLHLNLPALLLLAAATLAAQPVAITGARVVDGSGAPAREATVIVDGARIRAVGPGLAVPAGATVVDARGMTLLPGLFDLHTHLLASAGTGVSADWGKILKAYLYSGVTSVADMSTYVEQFEPMRRLVAGGLPAPRLHLAARFTTPGGHGGEGGRGDFHTQFVQTPREARAAVRRVLPYRPGVLKVFTDGWRYGADLDMTSMDLETLTALVDEAHKNSLNVLTHTVTVDKAKLAARAGVDVIIHGLGDAPIDDELGRLLKEKGTGYVQTLAVYEPRGRRPPPGDFLRAVLEPVLREQLRPARETADPARARRWQNLVENNRRARAAGVLLGAGTDAGMTGTWHGWSTLRELELMVEGGLTPLEAITAATATSARLLGAGGERGTISEGKLADFGLYEGRPDEQIADLYRLRRVWLDGREIDRAGLARDIGSAEATPLKAVPARALLDDFEDAAGRSRAGTLWLNNTDGGHDHSEMIYHRTLRAPGNHALTVLAKMSEKDRPAASMVLPLAPGAVEPVDARGFRGVEFEARGSGAYHLRAITRAARDRNAFAAEFNAAPAWRKTRIPFANLKQRPGGKAVWSGADLLALEFDFDRKAGEKAWLEIDNLRFYK